MPDTQQTQSNSVNARNASAAPPPTTTTITTASVNKPEAVGNSQMATNSDEKATDANNVSDGGSDSEDECDKRTLNDKYMEDDVSYSK